MIGALFLAAVVVQDAAKDRVPDAGLFDDLIRRTNDLKAFSAEYGVRTPELPEEQTLSIRYRSPGDLRVELSGITVMRVQDGVIECVISPPKGTPATARVPYGEWMRERRSRFTDVLVAELPIAKQDWPAHVDCGTVLQLRVTPSPTDDKENLQFQGAFQCPREALLSWLEEWRSKDDVRFDDDEHVVWTTSRGSRLRLSTRTGFLDRIEKVKLDGKVVFELKALDLDPEFGDDAFALPDAPPDAEDASAPVGGQMQGMINQSLRSEFCRWVSRHVGDKSLSWNDDDRVHVRKVFEALWTGGLSIELEPLISRTKEWIEKFAPALRAAYAGGGPDEESARGQVDEKVQEARERMTTSLERMIRDSLSKMDISEKSVPDESLRSSLLDLEKTAMESVFESAVREPLIEAFDEMVNRAKGGG